MRIKKDWRGFWLGFGVTVFLLVTALGLVTVDYRGRKMSFGDSTPVAEVERDVGRATLKVKAFGQERSWDVTKAQEVWEMVLDFGCIPHQEYSAEKESEEQAP